eukprot:1715678-Prymnesium_polylepis.2
MHGHSSHELASPACACAAKPRTLPIAPGWAGAPRNEARGSERRTGESCSTSCVTAPGRRSCHKSP